MSSKHHNINPTAANLSHIVNSLSFGSVLPRNVVNRLSTVPKDYFNLDSTQLMNGNAYKNEKLHQSFHHYIKVVTTNVDVGFKEPVLSYQMVQSSQIMKVRYAELFIIQHCITLQFSAMSVQVQPHKC